MKQAVINALLLPATIFFASMATWAAAAVSDSADGDLPSLGDASSGVISLEEERRVGNQFMQQLRRELPVGADLLLKMYCEHILYRLAAVSELTDRRLSLFLIENAQLNAFAAPGGVVGINLGLFLYAENEHEFSAVLAHELAHLSQRHYARHLDKRKQNLLPMLASILASVVILSEVGTDEGMASMIATQAALRSRQLSYSRSVEQEADRIGIRNLFRADMDPGAMAAMFERMNHASRFDQTPPEFLLTHPVTESRIADTRGLAAQYIERGKKYVHSADYPLLRARVQVRFGRLGDAEQYYRQALTNGDPASEVNRYGLALALKNKLKHDEAIALLKQLADENPQRLIYRLTLAEALTKAERAWQAIPPLEQALQLNPGNPWLNQLYADALVRQKRYPEAVQILKEITRNRPEDIDIWYKLAEYSGLAQDIIMVHRSRAEFFHLRGQYRQATEQLQYALNKLEKNDFRTTALINQRMEDFHALGEE